MANRVAVVRANYGDGDADGPFRTLRAGDTLVDEANNPLVVANVSPVGAIYVANGGELVTTITLAATYYKVAGTTTTSHLTQFTHPSAGRLTYTGTPTLRFMATAVVSGMVDKACTVSMRLAVNGSTLADTEQHRQFTAAGLSVLGIITVQGCIQLATNQYVEVYVATKTVTSVAFTAEHMHLMLRAA